MPLPRDSCINPILGPASHEPHRRELGGVVRRQVTGITPGYTTTDDFGTDGMYRRTSEWEHRCDRALTIFKIGDDIAHSTIPNYDLPGYWEADANFPASGEPDTVDVIFMDL